MESVDTLAVSAAGAAAPRIRVLPPDLVDQIAAGEVVERPASVVKELVENALDAGARRVEVTIEGGGRRLIRIVDDGYGMTPDEARLCVQRHATSKIVAADDLFGLDTFGFRGEALPSIASVSRLTLQTKARGALAGTRLSLEAGREIESREVGMPEGTQMEVRDLFFNTPARLKFLKAEATESANVSEAVLRLALAHPEVHFRLRQGDRTTMDLPVERDLSARVRAAVSRRGAGLLHEALGAENGVRVQAFVAAPEEAQNTARSAFVFVGRRFVRDRALLAALSTAYGELLEKGRYPVGVLFVDVPGPDVDVNVHPQKLEVRFARPQEVYGAVRHVVRAALERAPWLRGAPLRSYTLPPERDEGAEASGRGLSLGGPGFEGRSGARSLSEPRLWHPPLPTDAAAVTEAGAAQRARATGAGLARDEGTEPQPAAGGAAPAAAPTTRPGGTFFSELHYIGQLHRTYLICEGRDELVLVDQHAAHERVAFQRLRRAHHQRAVPRQHLLFPIRIEVGEAAVAAVRAGDHGATLAGLGFEVEVFGPTEIVVRAVPEPLKDADPKPLLVDVLAQLGDAAGASAAEAAFDHVLATMACHSVVRAGDVLTREQVLALLSSLDDVDLRSHCPHGRPVLLRLPVGEIERRFGR